MEDKDGEIRVSGYRTTIRAVAATRTILEGLKKLEHAAVWTFSVRCAGIRWARGRNAR